MVKVLWIAVGICVLSLAVGSICWAQGVTNSEIVVGQVAALEGPTKALGQGMRAGLTAYFSHINDQGGVNGRKITLKSYDDGYEPAKCIEQTRKMVDEGVFALIGYVGTPTSVAVEPIFTGEKIPFIGPFTGAEGLRNPVKRYILNVRASYFDETEGLVKRLTEDLGFKNIAIFYQNDSYGQAGLAGVNRALEKRGMSVSAEGTYERNTVAVKGGLGRISRVQPEAVIMIGAYEPCAEFIKLSKQLGMTNTKFCNISFVGSDNLKNALGAEGEGVIISQVVPFPWDKSIAVVEEYHQLLTKYQPQQAHGFVSLEGFLVAKMFVEGLKAAGSDLTREGLIDAIEKKGTFDLGGVTLTYSANDHQGMDQVNFSVISGGDFKPIDSFK